ncbi:MAG TPA: CHAP domain-containing protein [Acidimicrobiales bacterium]|nr:CHAP domain-containing protein [Acidimicrobiales bacterium]
MRSTTTAAHRWGRGLVVATMTVVGAWAGLAGQVHRAPPVHVAARLTADEQFSGTGISAYGDAASEGSFSGLTLSAPAVAMAATPDGQGYWVAAADGGVFAFGDAAYLGGMGGTALYAPIVGMAATPDGKGYWLVAADGGVFAFGDATYLGSLGGVHLAAPIVGTAATPDGGGYWLVAADGGVFAFGDAVFHGSLGGITLVAPVSGMAATPDGGGYWLVGSDGGVFAFGDAAFHGSVADADIGTWVTGIAATPDGQGYWLAAATAAVLPFGDAVSYGPDPNEPPFPPTAAIVPTPDGKGDWLLQPDSISTTFSSPDPPPSFPGGETAVRIAASQIGPDPDVAQGAYCNPYGPCEEWCALFATWVWQQVGVAIPRYPFTGSIDAWAAARHLAMAPTATPAPGDVVLYGTGPQNPATSQHVAIVAEVWPDGAITTIDGDAGPEPDGKAAVAFNGPFLPSQSLAYNGMAIYAFARA